MGYAEYLGNILRPLGVYDLKETSFSGGEIAALGRAFDDFESYAREKVRESMVLTAQSDGLTQMEGLFPFLATAVSVGLRRDAISGFLQVSGDSFTEESLCRCLSACGTQCVVAETEDPLVVSVRFPREPGEPASFSEKRRIIESLLPCHLTPDYRFTWCLWQAVEATGMTWGQAENLSFYQLALLGVE